MNKNELITFIRNPNSLTDADLGELEEIVKNSPYFLNGRFLLAKGSKDLKHPETKKRIASAAVYSTDRPLFKKYLSDKLFFLSQPPEEEELEPEEIKDVEANKPIIPSEKDKEVIDKTISKEDNKESRPKETSTQKSKSRREPRFDPTATASFQRRWDSKSETEQPSPEPKKKSKPVSRVTFAGKKIDRSKRSKKKSIRSEILGDSAPIESKTNGDTTEKKSQKISESKNETKKESSSEHIEKKNIVARSKKVTPRKKEHRQVDEEQKQEVKPEEQKAPLTPIKSNRKETPQQRQKVRRSELKKAPITTTKPTSKPEGKKTTSIRETNSDRHKLNTPKMTSGGIDSILAELKTDMQSLKSSRVKFAEVQQKIEEDDAVSAALEKATSKIPTPEPKSASEEEKPLDLPNSDIKDKSKDHEEETINEENDRIENIKKEKEVVIKEVETEKISEQKEIVKTKEEQKSKDDSLDKSIDKKEKTNIMPKAKKVIPSKKKIDKKGNSSKKTADEKSVKKESSEITVKEEKIENTNPPIKKDQEDIIDKFIADTPSIKYQKKTEQKENKDLSDQSSEWNKELASEYLAEIYLHQGNKKRAIEIYTALSLKFPDKKSYFADLISKTK
ncbi:MAG: hypothetical protein AB8B73_07950 [Ekhidna sp.]